MKKHQSVTLPESFIPMLAGNPGGFIVRMEGKRLIWEPREDAPQAKRTTVAAPPKGRTNGNGRVAAKSAEAEAQGATRPTFLYTVKDRRLSLEQAKRYGLSPTRLKVLQAVVKAKRGLKARDIMTRCKLSHGATQQTLHWLRAHQMVDGHEITL